MKTAALNNKDILSHKLRFEAEHYLNDNSFLCLALERNKDNCDTLENLATVFNPPVFKRQFCKPTSRSVQYFQSSDVQNAEEFSPVHIFKGQAESLNLLVNKGDVLVTGFGTIGNTRLVSKHQDGVCYANNVCRIRTNNNIPNGFIYAFMTSKYGYAQLNNNASGSVVRYIEAPGIKRTLVPRVSESFQKEVDELIQESARLREEATEALEEAKSIIFDFCCLPFSKNERKKINSLSLKNIINSFNTRLDPPIYINDGVKWVKGLKVTTKRLGDCKVKLWYPGMFKRVYVNNGLPYIKGSSLFVSNPFRSCEKLSRSKTPDIDELWLNEGMILISCAGACGQVKMITKEYNDKNAIGSPDIIRLVSSDELFTKEYLFAYLQIPPIYDYMQSLKYGSVIERFDTYNIENVPIVEPTKQLSERITSIIRYYMDCTYRAFNCEEKAISMVEEEIEKWNKN